MLLSKATYSTFRLYIFWQYACSLGIEPTTFALQTQCSTTEPQEHIKRIKHENTQFQGYSTEIFKIVIIYSPWCHPKLVCISFFRGKSKKIFCRTLGVKQCRSPLTFTVWTVKKLNNKNLQNTGSFLVNTRDISQTMFFYAPQKI